MAWYNTTGREQDVIVSSRIRFARNISDYPFEPRLDAPSAEKIISKVKAALREDYKYTDFSKITPIEAQACAEKHIISPEFAQKKTPHALFQDEAKQIDIMVCEEDHLRIQCIMSGLALDEAYIRACEADDILDDALPYAYSEELGYLTHCPTNLGTGMRASAMMFLPSMTVNKMIPSLQNQLSKIGLTIRGMSGEGSSADGCLYQISNQITLGVSEDETIKKLSGIITKIANQERDIRKTMFEQWSEKMSDKIKRAYGIMLHANLISSEEFLNLYSDVRTGITLGIITTIDYTSLDGLLASVLPANLILHSGESHSGGSDSSNPIKRDKARAELIRQEIM